MFIKEIFEQYLSLRLAKHILVIKNHHFNGRAKMFGNHGCASLAKSFGYTLDGLFGVLGNHKGGKYNKRG